MVQLEKQNYYEVEKILDAKFEEEPAGLVKTEFLIKWKDYDSDENQWVPYENVTKTVILDYLRTL